METVTLVRVYRAKANKQGEPYVSQKTGKPYTRLSIQTQEHGQAWLSGFDGKDTQDWKEGDKVQVLVEKQGEYLNFRTAPKAVTREEFDALVKRVEALEKPKSGYNPMPEEPEDDGNDPF